MRSLRLQQDAQLQRAEKSNPVLSQGINGSGVAILQDLLADLGAKFVKSFKNGCADGIFGAETLQAVKQFQSSSGLRADGLVGPQTLELLDRAIENDGRLEKRTGGGKASTGYW